MEILNHTTHRPTFNVLDNLSERLPPLYVPADTLKVNQPLQAPVASFGNEQPTRLAAKGKKRRKASELSITRESARAKALNVKSSGRLSVKDRRRQDDRDRRRRIKGGIDQLRDLVLPESVTMDADVKTDKASVVVYAVSFIENLKKTNQTLLSENERLKAELAALKSQKQSPSRKMDTVSPAMDTTHVEEAAEGVGIYLVSHEGVLLDANETMLRATGFKSAQVIGTHIGNGPLAGVIRFPQAVTPGNVSDQLSASNGPMEVDCICRTASGDRVMWTCRLMLMRGTAKQGGLNSTLCVFHVSTMRHMPREQPLTSPHSPVMGSPHSPISVNTPSLQEDHSPMLPQAAQPNSLICSPENEHYAAGILEDIVQPGPRFGSNQWDPLSF